VGIEFVTSDVYAAVDALGGRRFDVVYTGKGALCWLPDLNAWARVAADLLRPGGVLYVVDFHPLMRSAADEQPGPGVVLDRPYLSSGPLRTESAVSYEGTGEQPGDTVCFEWTHGIGTVLDAVRAAGLDLGDGWWGWPEGTPRLPLLFSLRASRPA
jgi:SAM-dependent methyltransferase